MTHLIYVPENQLSERAVGATTATTAVTCPPGRPLISPDPSQWGPAVAPLGNCPLCTGPAAIRQAPVANEQPLVPYPPMGPTHGPTLPSIAEMGLAGIARHVDEELRGLSGVHPQQLLYPVMPQTHLQAPRFHGQGAPEIPLETRTAIEDSYQINNTNIDVIAQEQELSPLEVSKVLRQANLLSSTWLRCEVELFDRDRNFSNSAIAQLTGRSDASIRSKRHALKNP